MAIKFSVTTNAETFLAEQQRRAKNIEFAGIVALTRTGQAIKSAEVNLMRRKLDNPTRFTLNSLQLIPARKGKPEAIVETKQGFGSVPAGRFLSPQVEGGQRRQKSHERQLGGYTHPGKDISLNTFGNLPGATYVKILSQLRISRDASQNATDSRRSTAKRSREAFFRRENIVYRRRGEDITPILIITSSPSYKERLPFFDEAQRVWERQFPIEFEKALAQYAG